MKDAVIASICEPMILDGHVEPTAKKMKGDSAQWKATHEAAFMQHGMQWPPPAMKMDPLLATGFKQREAECVHFANELFPTGRDGNASEGQWTFMDANHSFERLFKWPLSEGQEMTNPWRSCVPTMTANSSIAARRRKSGQLEIREIHGLEAMRLIGWDLGFWAHHASPFRPNVITPELLMDLAGNAWSSFAFLPLAIAALGSAPADFYHKSRRSVAHPTSDQDEGSSSSVESESS